METHRVDGETHHREDHPEDDTDHHRDHRQLQGDQHTMENLRVEQELSDDAPLQTRSGGDRVVGRRGSRAHNDSDDPAPWVAQRERLDGVAARSPRWNRRGRRPRPARVLIIRRLRPVGDGGRERSDQ